METTRLESVMRCRKIHTFICDGCGEIIGESEEYEDGYYAEIGEYEQKACIDEKWYIHKATYCQECASNKTKAVIAALKSIGFTEYEY